MLTRPYDASSCLYLYISQAFWVACSPRLDFLYPTVTEPIELVAELSILSVGYSSSLDPPSRNPELPSHSDVVKVEPLALLLILGSYLRPSPPRTPHTYQRYTRYTPPYPSQANVPTMT